MLFCFERIVRYKRSVLGFPENYEKNTQKIRKFIQVRCFKLLEQWLKKSLTFFIRTAFPKRNKNRYKNTKKSTVSHINYLILPF